MTGQDLYELYEDTNLRVASCEVDPWEHLTEKDQGVWDALAEQLGDT